MEWGQRYWCEKHVSRDKTIMLLDLAHGEILSLDHRRLDYTPCVHPWVYLMVHEMECFPHLMNLPSVDSG